MRKNEQGQTVWDVEMSGKQSTITFGPTVKILCGVVMADRAIKIAGDVRMAEILIDTPVGAHLAQDTANEVARIILHLKLNPLCPYPDDDEAIAEDILGEMGRGPDGKLLDVAPGVCPDCGMVHR